MSQIPVNPPSYNDAVQNKSQVDSTTGAPAAPSNFSSAPLNSNVQSPGQTHVPSYTGGFDNVLYKPQNQPPVNQPPARAPDNYETEEAGGFTVRRTFGEMDVRRLFIRKVFLTLGIQLLVTFGFVCLFYFVTSIKTFVQQNLGFYLAAYGVFLVMYFVLICFSKAARSHPYNLIMLACLTLALSYMVGTITSYYDIEAVIIGLGVTVVVCVTVMLFSIQTKYDFTKCAGLLFVLCMVLFFFGFITIFTYRYTWYLQVVYGSLGALLFTLFLAFDTQLVMGGRKYELDPEEHVFAALILYIDIIYIFIFLLSIFGGSSR